MKNLKSLRLGKVATYCIAMLVAFAFVVIGKGDPGEGMSMAVVVALTAEEKAEFNEPEQKMLLAVKKIVGQVEDGLKNQKFTAEEIGAFKSGVIDTLKNTEIKALKDELAALEVKAKAQGTSLADMEIKLTQGAANNFKTIGQVLAENEEELKKVYVNGSGTKTFMVNVNSKGELVMKPFDMTKAAAVHATIDGIDSGTAAVTQSIDAATLLRLGGASPIVSRYRNTPWVFDLVNTVNAGFDQPFAMWYEEQAKQGSSSTVLEGGTKPKVSYAYALKSASYKKEAALISFTDEFALDFSRLQSDIMGKGKTDVVNRINSVILANLTTAATAYNTAASFNGGVAMTGVNDYEVLAAMAAQVDNATFGADANSAIMSTFKKYRMGVSKTAGSGEWQDRPSVLDGLSFIGNPDMAADAVIVGDLKAYNVILRGGFIIKVGYNGTDFAENKFSVVMEQYYYDYISAIRQPAIVKGATFAAVKTLLQA